MMNGILLVYQTGPNQVFRTLLASLRFSHGYPFWWEVTPRTGMGWSLLGCKMIQEYPRCFWKALWGHKLEAPSFPGPPSWTCGGSYLLLLRGARCKLAVFIGEASEHVFPVQDVYPLMSTSQGFRLFRTPRILKMAGEPDCPLVIS